MPDPLRETLQASLGTAYTLTSELGGGGMSRVFVAREEALGRDVVVKVLSSEIAEGLSVERFGREIRLAAALQEPHIVPVLTAGVTALGMPYYTMPFVRGASLRERLTQGPLGVDEALVLLRDVAQALAYAHSHGVVHRDIKPENILLSSGTAVVTDFGIAKALQASRTLDAAAKDGRGITRTGTSLGTPAYMAPEQAAGDPDTDQRADLYAWGVVAYELLTGRHPFAERTSPQQLLRAHLTEVPAAFASDIDVPPAIAALVRQCLEKDPADRPPSATALLQQLQAGRGRTVEAVVPRHHMPRRTLAVVALAAIALVATGMWWRGTGGSTGSTTGAVAPVMMAVLPFEHAGPADQQPFTDGLTDAVTSKLASLSSLLVIDRRSAATYRGTTKPAQQIGKELGVRYLLEGVVRWAKDGAGAWRARVTPTLVDTKAGTIKWTGTPVDVTLSDPFTAQGSIATDVARAMEVAVLPAEQVRLARRFTDNPQAYAAYLRAEQILSAAGLDAEANPDVNLRAIRELNTAIALDSTFVEAWGALTSAHTMLMSTGTTDSSVELTTRRILSMALQRAPRHPRVLLYAAFAAHYFDKNRTAAESLITTALSLDRNSATTLAWASNLLQSWYPDSARALALRAAQLDPRSIAIAFIAADRSIRNSRWGDAHRFGDAILALDSTDERGWVALTSAHLLQGDSIGLERVSRRVLRHISKPSGWVTCNMAFGSRELSGWVLGLSAAQQRVASLGDSISYYDCKSDAALRIRNAGHARVFADSIIELLPPRRTASMRQVAWYPDAMLTLAYAYAVVGREAEAVELAKSVTESDMQPAGAKPPSLQFTAQRVATVYARIGDTASAIRWLELGLSQGFTAKFYKIDPRLRPLHGTAAFERFVRENDHEAR